MAHSVRSAFACVLLTIAIPVRAQMTNPVVVYVNKSATTTPLAREYASSSWGSALTASTFNGNATWSVVKNSPKTSESMLVTLADGLALTKSLYSGGSWSSVSQLTASAGTYTTAPFDLEYEQSTGNAMVVYRKQSTSTIYYRTYTTTSPSEQSFSIGFSGSPQWMKLVPKPNSNQLVLVASDSTGALCAAVWNGTSWGNTVALGTSLQPAYRAFDAAFMTMSGSAIVVWTAATGAPKYCVWNGTSWGSVTSAPAIGGGVPAAWITLAASPSTSSNDVLMACMGTDSQLNVNKWSGSAWSSNSVVETSAVSSSTPRFDLCYQADASKAVLAWHASGATKLNYRTWNGSAWSATTVGPELSYETLGVRLVRGTATTDLMLAARTRGSDDSGAYTVYSQGSTISLGSNTSVTGTVGHQVSGVVLPSAPAATAGSTTVTVPSKSTQTVTPGSYSTITISDKATVNFSTGTYVFTTFSAQDHNTLNFNTSGGPISIIITSGGATLLGHCSFNNTGSSSITFHVKAGNFSSGDQTNFTNFNAIVYAGNVSIGSSVGGTANLLASGSFTFGKNGSLSPTTTTTTNSSTRYVAVPWSSGIPGSVAVLSSTGNASIGWESLALAGGRSNATTVRVLRWYEVGPDD